MCVPGEGDGGESRNLTLCGVTAKPKPDDEYGCEVSKRTVNQQAGNSSKKVCKP